MTNRLLTVAAPQGNIMVIKLGPDVQHIEKIKVEDKVTIAYSEEVATSLQKLAGPPINKDNSIAREEESGMNMNAPTMAEQDWVEVNPSGDTDFTTVEVTDTVAAINYNKRLVTFAGTDGRDAHHLRRPERSRVSIRSRWATAWCCLVTRAVAVKVTPV